MNNLYIFIILGIIIFILLILNIINIIRYQKIIKQYYEERKTFTKSTSKLSMLEYTYRKFREGANPYTVLRQISNILSQEYPKD